MIFFFFLQMIVQTFVSPRMTAIIVYKVVVYICSPFPFLIPPQAQNSNKIQLPPPPLPCFSVFAVVNEWRQNT